MKKNKRYKEFYDIIRMDKEKDILIVDPYVVNIPDLINNCDVKNIVRIRKPFWGKGRLSEYINKVDPIEFKSLLEKLLNKEDIITNGI